MSIKQQVLDLAAKHGIEVWVGQPEVKGYRDNDFQINLPKGFMLDDDTTGLSGQLDGRLSYYQNWKALLLDVQSLVEQKNTWKQIDAEQETDVAEEADSIDQLLTELKTTRAQRAKVGA